MRFARRVGVTTVAFDSEYELQKIVRHAAGANILARIGLSIVGSAVGLSLKFGTDPGRRGTAPRPRQAYGPESGGSQLPRRIRCTRGDNCLEAFELAEIILDNALKDTPLNTVNIGGGFPIRHPDSDEDYSPPWHRCRAWSSTGCSPVGPHHRRAWPGHLRPFLHPRHQLIGKSIRNCKRWYNLDDGVYGCPPGATPHEAASWARSTQSVCRHSHLLR